MVARLNGVQEAAGSTPVTRTNKSTENRLKQLDFGTFLCYMLFCFAVMECAKNCLNSSKIAFYYSLIAHMILLLYRRDGVVLRLFHFSHERFSMCFSASMPGRCFRISSNRASAFRLSRPSNASDDVLTVVPSS